MSRLKSELLLLKVLTFLGLTHESGGNTSDFKQIRFTALYTALPPRALRWFHHYAEVWIKS